MVIKTVKRGAILPWPHSSRMEEEVFYPDNTSSASPDDTPFSSVDNVGSQGSSEENAGEDSDDDIDKMLSELQGFQEELEQGKESHEENIAEDLPSKPLDQFRFSIAAMEESGDIDLDALLEDLCSMEKDINAENTKAESEVSTDLSKVMANGVALPDNSNAPFSPKLKVSQDVLNRLENVQEETKELTAEEQQEKIKAEKIRIAMDKLRQARVKKLIVKVYNDEDPTSKTLAIDQTWTAWDVCKKMMRKDDKEPDPYWVLVERLYDLGVERMLEDHESVVDVVSNWPWDSTNKLVITNKREKYALFRNPQLYLLSSDTSSGAAHLAEKSKGILIEEYCKKDAMRLPELDGVMWLKEGRKTWRKHYFALRASGIYFNPKGRAKTSKELVCLIKFEHVSVFTALGFKKKHKSPTDYCLVLKHPQYHEIDSKAVRCLCAEDQKTLLRWIVGIRLAKYGYRMIEDYNQTQEEIDKMAFTLDRNQFARSSSFSNGENRDVAPPQLKIESPPPTEPVKDYKIKPRVPSERSRRATGVKTRTGAAFSAATNKQPPKPKAIKNLFSDAWKKGTEVEAKEMEQGSPETPSTPQTPLSPRTPFSVSSDGSGAVTPDFDTQKSFIIDNIINEQDDVQQELFIDSNPIQRKSFSGTLGRNNKQERSTSAHVYSVVSKSSAAPTSYVQPPPIPPQLNISDGWQSSHPPLYEEINVKLPISSDPSPLDSTVTASQGRVPVAPPPPPLVMDKTDNIPPPPPPVMRKPNAFPSPPLMRVTPDASGNNAVEDVDIPPPPPPVMEKPKMKASSVEPASTEVSAAPPPPPPKMSNPCHPSTGNAGIPAPPPPPPLPSMPISCTSKAPVSVNKNNPPPPPVKQKPKMESSSSSSSVADSCGHNTPPPVAVKPKTKSQLLADDVFVPLAPPCNIPPPPAFQTSAPPPVAKKPKSRSKSTSPPPSVGIKTVPPPVATKPKSSVKFSTSSVSKVEKDLAPPPPPVAAKPRSKSVGAKSLPGRGPEKAVDIEMDFPPPPPEVLFQETLNRSLTMSPSMDSEYSQRRNSFGKLPPPLPKRDSSLANLEGHH